MLSVFVFCIYLCIFAAMPFLLFIVLFIIYLSRAYLCACVIYLLFIVFYILRLVFRILFILVLFFFIPYACFAFYCRFFRSGAFDFSIFCILAAVPSSIDSVPNCCC